MIGTISQNGPNVRFDFNYRVGGSYKIQGTAKKCSLIGNGLVRCESFRGAVVNNKTGKARSTHRRRILIICLNSGVIRSYGERRKPGEADRIVKLNEFMPGEYLNATLN